MSGDPVRLGFVCVQNAGRSQMAAAFAERERDRRGLGDRVEVLTGGTDPAETVHGVVVEAMQEVGIDLADRSPRAVTDDEIESYDHLATKGCSTLEVDPSAGVEVHPWSLEDPHGKDIEAVRTIREATERNVLALFDEVFGRPADGATDPPTDPSDGRPEGWTDQAAGPSDPAAGGRPDSPADPSDQAAGGTTDAGADADGEEP